MSIAHAALEGGYPARPCHIAPLAEAVVNKYRIVLLYMICLALRALAPNDVVE